MVAVSSSTAMFGVSHINPNGRSSLPLLTEHGREYYKRKARLYEIAKKSDTMKVYKNYLFNEQQHISKLLSHLLLDDDMCKKHKMNDEDIKGWTEYKELSDEYTVLAYFIKK